MTFISTVTTKQGIVLSADSLELLEGGQILWEDFAEILAEKIITEDDTTKSISASEVHDKFKKRFVFTKGRIRSTCGAKKIFQLGNQCAILIAGIANPGGKDFKEITEIIERTTIEKTFNNYLENSFLEINSLMSIDSSPSKNESEIIFCGYDESDRLFKVYKLKFVAKYEFDEKGNFKLDRNGNRVKFQVFEKSQRIQPLNLGGWKTHVLGIDSTFNELNVDLSVLDGFHLSENLMKLVVTIEEISNSVPGIGGKIFHAAITTNGFHWINSETDIMNLKL